MKHLFLTLTAVLFTFTMYGQPSNLTITNNTSATFTAAFNITSCAATCSCGSPIPNYITIPSNSTSTFAAPGTPNDAYEVITVLSANGQSVHETYPSPSTIHCFGSTSTAFGLSWTSPSTIVIN